MLTLSTDETQQLSEFIAPNFHQYESRYDTRKYPPDAYERFKIGFSSAQENMPDVRSALIWKWGHTGKPNFPAPQNELIRRIEKSWADFANTPNRVDSLETFKFWRTTKGISYITAAFLTHLTHLGEVPIIDRHNFRGMNRLMRQIRTDFAHKKMPSSWADIVSLKSFMAPLAKASSICELRFDRFLMMYGKYSK